MRKTLCIVIGLTIAATVASVAQAQQPSPIQRIIAQENANSLTLQRRQALRSRHRPSSTAARPTPSTPRCGLMRRARYSPASTSAHRTPATRPSLHTRPRPRS
jgi:hypothetical protein